MGEAAGRRFHRGGGLAARAMVPTVGGNGLAAERLARGDVGAFRRRRLRRLHPRQDRADRAGRRRVAGSRLRQHVFDAARRQGALWPDAARGRFRDGRRHDRAARAGALRHVDDYRPCPKRDAASRVLPPGSLARTRRRHPFGNGALGAIRRRRPAFAGAAAESFGRRASISPTRPFRSWLRENSPSAA